MAFRYGAALASVFYVAASPAMAGEQPLYLPAPEWITLATLPETARTATEGGPVMIDIQHRIDGATVWQYSDMVTRLDTPEALSQNAAITLPWSPDKGDLIIHQLSILRGGEVIDALASGQKFTVLRREQQLEQRELTGVLSATLAVEGLQVGDMLRLRASVTTKDSALGGRAQLMQWLIAEPVRLPSAAYQLSWRTDQPTQWKILADKVAAKPVRKGAFATLPVAVPIPKQPDRPEDAPGRFNRIPMIEASTFTNWADVSRVMAPLYATDGIVPPDSAIATEIAAITKATDDPLRRTAMALQLVQDKIRYLAVGMDGGNYVPQSPVKTWEARYGDCKAKTLLLLAMLHAMEIEAEPVLAHVDLGDLVPDRVPSALAFNHVLVRAVVGGETLWLDGTALGTRLADIGDTPPLGHVLPVRIAGGELIKIALRPPARPSIDLMLEADESTSVDLPSVIDLTMVARGQLASLLTLATSQMPPKALRESVEQVLQTFVGEAQYQTVTTTPDVDNGTVTIKARGVFTTGWRLQGRRTERWMSRLPNLLSFEPDRARPAWADIPVATAAPDLARYRMRIKLPDGGQGYAIEGDQALDTQIAGFATTRSVQMEDGFVVVDETIGSAGAEIAVDQIAAERDRVATTLARVPRLIAPKTAVRRWNLEQAPSQSQVQAISAIYADTTGEADEDDVTALSSSHSFHRGIGDFKAAAEDLTRQLAILPSADAYLDRADVRSELGDFKGALADAEEARKLDPASVTAVATVAALNAELGDLPKSLRLIEERMALGGKTREEYRETRAFLLGEFGNAEDAIAELDGLIEEKPGMPDLLNQRCWVKASRSIQMDTAVKDCTAALELSTSPATILDSRALAWLRMDRIEDALRDLDAALLQSPGLSESRFLRAIVYRQMGREADAKADMAIALRLSPSLARRYARFGLKP